MFSKAFHEADQAYRFDKEQNVTSHIVANGAGLTIVEWTFHNKGHVVPTHAHYHEQVAYIIKGSCEGELADGSKAIYKAGEAMYFGPNEIHTITMLEADTVILDVFTPCRLDHLANHTEYPKR